MDTKVVAAAPQRSDPASQEGEALLSEIVCKEGTDRVSCAQSPQTDPEGRRVKAQSVPGVQQVSSCHEDKVQYAAQLQQLDREALFTLGAALLVTLVFWFSIYCTHDSSLQFLSLPLWFVLSCIGGYLFSVVMVAGLIRCLLKPCELNVVPASAVQSDASSATKAAPAAAQTAPAGAAAALSDDAKKVDELRG